MISNLNDQFEAFSMDHESFPSFRRNGSPINEDKNEDIPEFITQLLDEQNDFEPPKSHTSFTEPHTPSSTKYISDLSVLEPSAPISPFRNLSSTFLTQRNQRICKFYQIGQCKFGDNCKFLHIKTPSQEKIVSTQTHHFEMTSPTNVCISDFGSDFSKMCHDQYGCRYLQRQLEDNNPQTTKCIFEQMLPIITLLMSDPFGNYLCQKLIEVVNSEQRIQIITKITPTFFIISKNIHGTRSIQKLISCYSTKEEQNMLINVISPYVIELIFDSNGNHVIQECLKTFGKSDNGFIFDAIVSDGNLVKVATHKHGCCVVQRCIDYGNRQQLITLIDEIVKNSLVLVKDAFGNYVVQYILNVDIVGVIIDVTKMLLDDLIDLSMQKFSSNVIEKLVRSDEIEARQMIFDRFLQIKDVTKLLQDSYANYVIQTCLDQSSVEYHSKLSNWIIPHLSAIRNTPYYKKIQNKLLRDENKQHHSVN
ncbi:hypothetical protein ENUP19_0349G0006 [Entamoeba nuttalli]|uniref:Pumilio family RNA-binding protein n=1 Tax=Entamoeba nuttalli TaxID=412467 RepID=A0ABQ0DXU1_9EUKA